MPLHNVFSFHQIRTRFRDVLFRHDDVPLKELLARTGNEDVEHLIDSLPAKEKRRLFRLLPPDRKAHIAVKLSDHSQQAVLGPLALPELRAMIDAVESDRAVDLIQLLDEAKRAKVLDELRKNDPSGILPLLVFGEQTAGGRMKTELMRFKRTATVEDVRRALAAPGKLKSHQLYVVDDADALVGTLAPLKLLQAGPSATLAEIMSPTFVALPATMDQEEVAREFDEHNAIELPVVSAKGKLLGIITADDIFEVMEEEYKEDVSRLAGIDEDDHVSDPVHLTVRRRLPWLLVNLGTALVAASVVGVFQETIERIVVLAAFMPIVAGMGGNAATQTLGVVVRAIALGEIKHVSTARTVAKQVAVGTFNGFSTGLVMGGIALAWTGNLRLSGVILAAMTANMLIAGLGGVVVPVTLKSMRVDPALASSVFVTALTDICGFFVFLGLASVLL